MLVTGLGSSLLKTYPTGMFKSILSTWTKTLKVLHRFFGLGNQVTVEGICLWGGA